jgi:hypothetical protein
LGTGQFGAAAKDGERYFVDGLWAHLDASFKSEAERRLARFVQRQATTKWIMAADFCIRDHSRPNDSFAFVILPGGDKLRQTNALLSGLPRKDLKETKLIDPAIKRALRGGQAFTICVVADRERRLYADAASARRGLDQTIEMMENWKNADECSELIGKVRAVREQANKASLNLRLLEDLIVVSAITAYLVAVLCKLGPVELVGWAPDRDKIVECYSGIAQTLFGINVAALCEKRNLKQPELGFFTQTSENLWCDTMIRLADYVAGVAAWDPPANDRVSPKIAELVAGIFADNRHLFLFRMAFRSFEEQTRIKIAQVRITKSPPPGRDRERLRVFPLRGMSRSL